MVMSKINKVLVVMKKYHDSGVFYKCVGISLGGLSECEENVGQLPSILLLPQFSTTISAAKLVDSSFSAFSCIDSPIPKP